MNPKVPARTPEQQLGDQLAVEAQTLLGQRQLKDAEAKFNEALTHDPDNPTPYTFLCYMSFIRGEHPAARERCAKALSLNPQIPLALLIQGRMNEVAGNPDQASEDYLNAAKAGVLSKAAMQSGGLAIAAHAHYLRALILAKKGDNEGALTSLDEMLKVFPSNADAHYERGLVLLALDRNDDAAEAFKKALEERPNWAPAESWLYPNRRYFFLDENAHYWRGVALAHAGHPEPAITELTPLLSDVESRIGSEIRSTPADAADPNRILEGDPDLSYYHTHLDLARIYAGIGQKGKAVDTIRQFLKAEQWDKVRIQEAKDVMKDIK